MENKKYVNLSAFGLNQPNRGNSALCYGTVTFLTEKGLLSSNHEIINFRFYRNPFKVKTIFTQKENLRINEQDYKFIQFPVNGIQRWLLIKFGILLPFTKFKHYVKNMEYEAAAYGGDGFSDIYGDKLFLARLTQTIPLMAAKIPLILLPQTIGPFGCEKNKLLAHNILRYASRIYVRDNKYEEQLKALGLKYEKTKDLSAYMIPESWTIEICPRSIGINVSGLAYYNKFVGLEGQFDNYPELINRLICFYRDKGHKIYLIPHSYNYFNPEKANDDFLACKEAYEQLLDKTDVTFVNKNLTSPQVKYLISKMSFFIGTRMHANFAAIYTGVPVFGLAYSYKFAGAFNANGLDGDKQTAMINNMRFKDIDKIIKKIDSFYHKCF